MVWGNFYKDKKAILRFPRTKAGLDKCGKMGIIKTEGRSRKRWSLKKLPKEVTAYLAMSGYFLFVSCSTKVATPNKTKV